MIRIFSTLLILIIVYSTIGIRVNEHHCDVSNKTSYTYFEADDCCSKTQTSCVHHQKKDDCCSDEISIIHFDNDIHFNLQSLKPALLLSFITILSIESKQGSTTSYLSYKLKGRAPPLIISTPDIQSLFQVYII